MQPSEIPKTYKLIGAHGSIRAKCELSYGDAIVPVPHNICLVFLADLGSAITSKVSINHPSMDVNYGLYLNKAKIEQYFNNPLGENVPEIFKNATILVDGHMYQDMTLQMPPNPEHINESVKRFPPLDYQKGIYSLPLDRRMMSRLGTAHLKGPPRGQCGHLTRFDILNDEYGQSGPHAVRFKLSEYVTKLSKNGGGYIFIDACRVIRGPGGCGDFTQFRHGLVTWNTSGTMINASTHPQFAENAKAEANNSMGYKKTHCTPGVGVRRGLRELAIDKERLDKLRRNNSKMAEILKMYSQPRGPPQKFRDEWLEREGLSKFRYWV